MGVNKRKRQFVKVHLFKTIRRKEIVMLALQLKSGEYLTIGDDVVVQIFQQPGSSFRVEIKAPREVPILRGAVRERSGEARPDGLCDRRPSQPSRRVRNARNLQKHLERKEREEGGPGAER